MRVGRWLRRHEFGCSVASVVLLQRAIQALGARSMTQYRTIMRTIDLGAGRLSGNVGPMVVSLGKALSAAGNGRRRLAPLDSESVDDYVSTPRSVGELTAALLIPADITIVSGHGCWVGEGWALSPSRSGAIAPSQIKELLNSQLIPSDLVILDACWAADSIGEWTALVPEQSLVLAARDLIGLPEATRWIATLLLCLSAHTGEPKLTRQQYIAAIAEVRRTLDSQAAMGGSKPISDEFVLAYGSGPSRTG